MALVFSYGTLMDTDIQSALFGRTIRSEKAVLSDWSLYISSDGYAFIKPEKNGRTAGMVFTLTDSELETADRWEEVPVYNRERVAVITADGKLLNAWAYTRRDANGKRFNGPPLGTNGKDYILREAQNLRHIK